MSAPKPALICWRCATAFTITAAAWCWLWPPAIAGYAVAGAFGALFFFALFGWPPLRDRLTAWWLRRELGRGAASLRITRPHTPLTAAELDEIKANWAKAMELRDPRQADKVTLIDTGEHELHTGVPVRQMSLTIGRGPVVEGFFDFADRRTEPHSAAKSGARAPS